MYMHNKHIYTGYFFLFSVMLSVSTHTKVYNRTSIVKQLYHITTKMSAVIKMQIMRLLTWLHVMYKNALQDTVGYNHRGQTLKLVGVKFKLDIAYNFD